MHLIYQRLSITAYLTVVLLLYTVIVYVKWPDEQQNTMSPHPTVIVNNNSAPGQVKINADVLEASELSTISNISPSTEYLTSIANPIGSVNTLENVSNDNSSAIDDADNYVDDYSGWDVVELGEPLSLDQVMDYSSYDQVANNTLGEVMDADSTSLVNQESGDAVVLGHFIDADIHEPITDAVEVIVNPEEISEFLDASDH